MFKVGLDLDISSAMGSSILSDRGSHVIWNGDWNRAIDCLVECSESLNSSHARIQKVLSEGSNFDIVFLVDEEYHYKRAIIGPPAKRHLNGVSLAY